MRYLRLFENFNDYYWNESPGFFKSKGEKINFTDRQIEVIKRHLGEGAELSVNGSQTAITVGLAKKNPSVTLGYNIFYIYAYNDEWFRCILPHHNFPGFICDGFDGLIKFLEDLVAGKVAFSFFIGAKN